MSQPRISPASFRDPSGFIFEEDGSVYRQVNRIYRPDYDALMGSGLYGALVERGWLVPHQEVDLPPPAPEIASLVLRPEPIPFISYPYEWSFSQLQDAALLTLDIQLAALEHGLSLKDASAYNVQFVEGRPVFIDTLSFERYEEGKPWVAYRQFCQHFLAPLALMAKRDIRLSRLLRVHIDGIPLDLASRLLPRRTWFSYGLLMHLHLHARVQRAYSETDGEKKQAPPARKIGRLGLQGILEGLRRTVSRLSWRDEGTEWGKYYEATNYSDEAFEQKKRLVATFLDEAAPKTVWDLGANTGVFSRLASDRGVPTVAFDIDDAAVETNYRRLRSDGPASLLPLRIDLSNPSPALGWASRERMSLGERGPAGCVMALALVHHLAIGNNVPLPEIARFFAEVGDALIIEFVPKEDSQVQRLLRSREDVFPDYHEQAFEAAFSAYFDIQRREAIPGSARTLYRMQARCAASAPQEVA